MELVLQSPGLSLQRCQRAASHAENHNGSRAIVVVAKKELDRCKNSMSGRLGCALELQRNSLNDKTILRNSTGRVVSCAVKEGQEVVNSSSQIPEKVGGSSSSFLTFLCPLLKLIGIRVSSTSISTHGRRYNIDTGFGSEDFGSEDTDIWSIGGLDPGGDPAAPRNAGLESATSGIASLARLPWGSQVDAEIAAERGAKGQPPELFQLYEFDTNVKVLRIFGNVTEACPYCRRVREALTELDLSAEVYPCPKGSLRHREFVRMNGGKEQFPYFLDPNTGVSLYESSEIVNYLFREYGGGRQPTTGLLESTLVTGWMPTILRAGRGMMLYSKANTDSPPKKLELFSYENNQFARLVREALCELELPYILRNVGKGSSLRPSLLKLAGSTQVPYLVDPNSGKALPESLNIISYLFRTYGSKS